MNQPETNLESLAETGFYHNGSQTYYSLEVTTRKTRLGRTIVERCASFGIVSPVSLDEKGATPAEEPLYTEADLQRLRRVRRLINELGLNWAGVEVVMRLTDELERVRQELSRQHPQY